MTRYPKTRLILERDNPIQDEVGKLVTSFNPRGGGASATLAFESIFTPLPIPVHYRLITDTRTYFLLLQLCHSTAARQLSLSISRHNDSDINPSSVLIIFDILRHARNFFRKLQLRKTWNNIHDGLNNRYVYVFFWAKIDSQWILHLGAE